MRVLANIGVYEPVVCKKRMPPNQQVTVVESSSILRALKCHVSENGQEGAAHVSVGTVAGLHLPS
jgi:hypothetical protein